MKALILRQDPVAATAISRDLIDKGFKILCVETLAVAHALIRVDAIDLLIMDERIEGQLTHALALSGERKNPDLRAIMMTDRSKEDTDDLFELVPSLYAMVGHDVTATVIGTLADAAMRYVADMHAAAMLAKTVNADVIAGPDMPAAYAAVPSVQTPVWENQAKPEPTTAPAHPLLPVSYADVAVADPVPMQITAVPVDPPLDNIDAAVRAQIAALLREQMPYTRLAAAPSNLDARPAVPA